jgi:predicted transcriptional regulator of viral defense system
MQPPFRDTRALRRAPCHICGLPRRFGDAARPGPRECHVMGVERAAVHIAARQHGVITRAQLITAGLSADAIRHHVVTGWLQRMHRGVYLIGAVEPPLAWPTAAVLACGDAALLSHSPAAVHWSIRPPSTGAIHVTVVGRHVRGPAGVTVHRTTNLHPHDATRHRGIPVTSLARTLLDIASDTPPKHLARALDAASDTPFQTMPSKRSSPATPTTAGSPQ